MNSSWSFMWSVTLICIPGEWKPVEGVIKYTESGKLRLFNRTVQPGCEYLPVFLTSAGFNTQQEWSAVLTVPLLTTLFSSRGGSDIAHADDHRRGRAADDIQYFSTEADSFVSSSFFPFSTLSHQSLYFCGFLSGCMSGLFTRGLSQIRGYVRGGRCQGNKRHSKVMDRQFGHPATRKSDTTQYVQEDIEWYYQQCVCVCEYVSITRCVWCWSDRPDAGWVWTKWERAREPGAEPGFY